MNDIGGDTESVEQNTDVEVNGATESRSRRFERASMHRVAQGVDGVDLDVFAATATLVRLVTRVTQDVEQRVHRPAGWSYAGFRIMFTIWVEGALEPRDIALYSGLSRAAVSSALNTLERDGLITRTRESTDRRLVTTRLTAEGERRLVEAYALDNAHCVEAMNSLTVTELKTLAELCGRMLETPRTPKD